ncbi:hypothetical protein JCGZ_09460 [Jatropha curcas]|uniref:Uncharacterized protein n=1 Tax=Jatropha curcas TaxID=180498 RepID=A0A067KGF9_JATCU|nr:uncharacterized protein LOC119369487 [Jatropha curcas]KDP35301.1 hypothetical protein JCGZ_09460 [Jatropha curcas]
MQELQAMNRTQKFFTDMEMVAAQQLMQLSDEDNSNSNSINEKKSKNMKKSGFDGDIEEEFDRFISQDEITSKKIEEIFGKEEEEKISIILGRPRKKRYRSLESIYKTTKQIKVGN